MPMVEEHPIPPFFPKNARVLFLGSFPPPRNRWCMEFFYPNLQNDFWRILGLVFFDDKEHFLEARPTDGKRVFARRRIEAFLREHQIAMYDTAVRVIRQRGNASDAFLTVVEPLDLERVLRLHLPSCRALITTGEKATDTLLGLLNQVCGEPIAKPGVGACVEFTLAGRALKLYRLPSSSRAYPMKLEQKAEIYRRILGLELQFKKG